MLFAREQGWRTFLVLEDDACLEPLLGVVPGELHDELFERHANWDVCFLGFSKAFGKSLELGAVGKHGLYEIRGCYTAHAYLVRERARDWIIRHLPEDAQAWSWHARHRIVDRWYARHLFRALRVFAVTPALATQRVGFSDIMQRSVDYADEFASGMNNGTRSRFIFEFNKWLAHLQSVWTDGYDALRGAFKRLKGF